MWDISYSLGLLMGTGGSVMFSTLRGKPFPIKFVVPSFLFAQLMAAFLRNDGEPQLATKAVLTGGIFNVFGDWLFVFALDMGIMGAGLATAMGSVFSLIIMLTYFAGKM